nr:MAG TPA: hypothetical protein [Caudoviricetes sp.]
MQNAPWFFYACLPCMRGTRALFIPFCPAAAGLKQPHRR